MDSSETQHHAAAGRPASIHVPSAGSTLHRTYANTQVRLRGEVHRLIAPRDQKYQSNFVEVRHVATCWTDGPPCPPSSLSAVLHTN